MTALHLHGRSIEGPILIARIIHPFGIPFSGPDADGRAVAFGVGQALESV